MNDRKQITRRDFLKKAAAASAVIGFPTIIPSSVLGENAPSNRIAMGAIGVGGQGTHNMRSFVRRSEVQMLAVCDVDRYHRDTAKGIVDQQYNNADCTSYTDFR